MSATTSRKNERKRIVQPQYAWLRMRFADGSLVAMREMDRLNGCDSKMQSVGSADGRVRQRIGRCHIVLGIE
jgi:hypothetical protein